MGIELIDLTLRVEEEFDIKIDHDDLMNLLNHGNTISPPLNAWTDILVEAYVRLVEYTIMHQHVTPQTEVFARTRKQIAISFGIEESKITPSSWMVHDLLND